MQHDPCTVDLDRTLSHLLAVLFPTQGQISQRYPPHLALPLRCSSEDPKEVHFHFFPFEAAPVLECTAVSKCLDLRLQCDAPSDSRRSQWHGCLDKIQQQAWLAQLHDPRIWQLQVCLNLAFLWKLLGQT
jgi:hypothetical protein